MATLNKSCGTCKPYKDPERRAYAVQHTIGTQLIQHFNCKEDEQTFSSIYRKFTLLKIRQRL